MQAAVAAGDTTSELAIFARLIEADDGNLARPLARYVLTLGFEEADQTRMHDLATRNQEGRFVACREGGTEQLRQSRAPARSSSLQGEEVAEQDEGELRHAWPNRWPIGCGSAHTNSC